MRFKCPHFRQLGNFFCWSELQDMTESLRTATEWNL